MSAFASPLSWRRFARLGREQQWLRVEAFARLAVAALGSRVQPFERLIGSAALSLGTARPVNPQDVADAVRWAAAVAPFRAVCLHRGLACQAMLRRRGVDAWLHYGLAVGGELKAHVWVTVAGEPVIGSEAAARFEPVASFPDH